MSTNGRAAERRSAQNCAGHGEKLTRKQEQAIAALLSHATLKGAARAAGLSPRTLSAWLKSSELFKAEFRTARRRVLEQAVSSLTGATRKAVAALVRCLKCKDRGIEMRAAVAVLGQAMRAAELLDLTERVEDLERRAAAQQGARP
jgi:hypothetical protein